MTSCLGRRDHGDNLTDRCLTTWLRLLAESLKMLEAWASKDRAQNPGPRGGQLKPGC